MIGIFDSGVGGLGVLAELRRILPAADIIYLADHAATPYGVRTLQEVEKRSRLMTAWLEAEGCRIVVLACNTASAAALHPLRRDNRSLSFVGMEPAVKPAARLTGTGRVGVVATAATFQGELFASVVDRFARGIEVHTAACPRWVELVESGLTAGPRVEQEVARCLQPMVDKGIDVLVLACTHFPALGEAISHVAGPSVQVVDPSPAVAAHAARLAADLGCADGTGTTRLLSTARPAALSAAASRHGIDTASALLPLADMDPRDAALRRALAPDDEGSLHTLPELAEETGLSPAVLEVLTREGLLIPRVDQPEPLYHLDDAEAVRAGLELVESGLPLAELLEVARRADEAMRPVAQAAVDAFVRFVSDPVEGTAPSEEEAAARLVDAFERMLPAARRLIGHHFQQLLIEDARSRLKADSLSRP